MGEIGFEIGQCLGKKARLHINQSAIPDFRRGPGIKQQYFFDDCQRFLVLLPLAVNPLEIVEHPGDDCPFLHGIEEGGAHLHGPVICLVQEFLAVPGGKDSAHLERVNDDIALICHMFHEEMPGEADPVNGKA